MRWIRIRAAPLDLCRVRMLKMAICQRLVYIRIGTTGTSTLMCAVVFCTERALSKPRLNKRISRHCA